MTVYTAVFMLLCLGVSANARAYNEGDLQIPYSAENTGVDVDPLNVTQAMPGECGDSAVADFAARDQLQQFKTPVTTTSRWGPYPNQYPSLSSSQVPAQCNPTAWAWRRVQQAMLKTISIGLNYCHHHAPNFTTPLYQQVWCDPTEPGVDSSTCVCNKAGQNMKYPWAGLDCSNYAAWIYNAYFGYYPTSSIGAQACSSSAPGRLLTTISLSKLDQLYPGDLVYITLGKSGRTAPVRVSHVVLWTGWTVNFTEGATGMLSNASLVRNLPLSQRSGAVSCMRAQLEKGLPVYVISDSTHSGPNLRPFCGWYMSSFSHARRVVNPDGFPDENDAAVAYYDSSSGNCMSWWALQY